MEKMNENEQEVKNGSRKKSEGEVKNGDKEGKLTGS